MRFTKLTLLASVLLLAACGNKANDDPEYQPRQLTADEQWGEISDRNWEVIQLQGKELLPGTLADMYLSSDWKASGNAGCNTWFAFIAARQGNRIRFTRFNQATNLECPQPKDLMEQESEFFQVIQLVDSFELVDDKDLKLYSGKKQVMLLWPKSMPAPPQPPATPNPSQTDKSAG
jgi:heat shock protein HslJ